MFVIKLQFKTLRNLLFLLSSKMCVMQDIVYITITAFLETQLYATTTVDQIHSNDLRFCVKYINSR